MIVQIAAYTALCIGSWPIMVLGCLYDYQFRKMFVDNIKVIIEDVNCYFNV